MGLRRRPGRRPNRARRNHQGLGQGECWAHLSGEGDGVQAWSTNGLVRWDAAWSFQRRADLYAFTAGERNHEIHHARGVHRPYAADDLALHTRPGTIVYAICQRSQAEGGDETELARSQVRNDDADRPDTNGDNAYRDNTGRDHTGRRQADGDKANRS